MKSRLPHIFLLICVSILASCSFNLAEEKNPVDEKSLTLQVMCMEPLEGIMPGIADDWNIWRGRNNLHSVKTEVIFDNSAGLNQRIAGGAPCQIAVLETDAERKAFESAGLAGDANAKQANFGFAVNTILVVLVRTGNPARIVEFADLTRPGVKVIQPDTAKSGMGQWGVIGVYNALLQQNQGDIARATETLRNYKRNVVSQPHSIKTALAEFKDGKGDALVCYESSAMNFATTEKGFQIVIPSTTLVCEHVVCLMDKNGTPEQREAALDLAAFLTSVWGQRSLTSKNFLSPLHEQLNPPTRHSGIKNLLRVDDLGGFLRARQDIVVGIWEQ